MTEETREILSAGRECYSALTQAREILEKDEKGRVPKRIRQALERTKPILFGDHLAVEVGPRTRMISEDPGYYD